jgi:hypothetical protein
MLPPPVHRPGSRPDAKTLQAAAADAGVVLPDAAVQAFREGRMIEAIKLIRTANPGLDLTRAKAAMERLQASQRAAAGDGTVRPREQAPAKAALRAHDERPPTVAMGDAPGQLRWVLLVLFLLAAAAWIGFGGLPG